MAKHPGCCMHFERLVKDGENPKGFTAQTVNGTAHWKGVGWNRLTWPSESSSPQQEPDGELWKEGRHNRTAE
jgi:hypothetical protein